jgi:hypothetical protein
VLVPPSGRGPRTWLRDLFPRRQAHPLSQFRTGPPG